MVNGIPLDGKVGRQGTDLAKKESVAKTRYMDKQKVASVSMATGQALQA